MKLCNIIADGRIHLGVVTGRGVVDAAAAGFEPDMDAVIAGAGLDELRRIERDGSLPAVEEPEYANVVCRPGKLLCVGLNYRDHAAGINMKAPEQPVLFSKFADALVPSGAQVELPGWEQSYDYEAELVIVIGRKAWGVDEAAAMDCVFGYTCGNDLSCRDIEGENPLYLPQAKVFRHCAALGPGILIAEEPIGPETAIACEIVRAGAAVFSGRTTLAQMKRQPDELAGWLFREDTFPHGAFLMTGTGIVPPDDFCLQTGDEVRISIAGIGTLINTLD